MSETTFTSEYSRVQANISAAYDALEAKGATMPENKNTNNLVNTIDEISTGVDINGIIEEYQITTKINAGDFVSKINVEQTRQSLLNDDTISGFSYISINDNKIFAAYIDTNANLYGMIIQISNSRSIITFTPTLLMSSFCRSGALSIIPISETKVCIINHYSSSYCTYGLLCSINDTNIESEDSKIDFHDQQLCNLKITKVNENKIVMIGKTRYNNQFAGIMVDIDDGTVTPNTPIIFEMTEFASKRPSFGDIVSCYSGTRVIIGMENTRYNDESYPISSLLTTVLLNIENNDFSIITYRTDKENAYTSYVNSIHLAKISENKVFMVHQYGHTSGTSNCLGSRIITITDSGMSASSDTILLESQTPATNLVETNNSNNFYCTPSYLNNGVGQLLFLHVDTTSATTNINKFITFNSSNRPSSRLSYQIGITNKNDDLLITFRYDNIIYGFLLYNDIKPFSQNNSTITGIAAESGSAGQTIGVYVPNI